MGIARLGGGGAVDSLANAMRIRFAATNPDTYQNTYDTA
jgi:hypothetical protein